MIYCILNDFQFSGNAIVLAANKCLIDVLSGICAVCHEHSPQVEYAWMAVSWWIVDYSENFRPKLCACLCISPYWLSLHFSNMSIVTQGGKKMEIAISLPATCQQLLIYIGCPKLTLFQQNQNFIYRVFWVWECNSMIEFLLMSRRSQVQSLAPASKVKCSISNAELDWPVIWLKAACICQFSHFSLSLHYDYAS